MRRASAYLRGNQIFVQGYAQTNTELWIAEGPVFVATPEDPPAEIGSKVSAALAHSRTGVKHPSQDQWPAVQAPMLTAAGVRSWATFAKGTQAVGIEEVGGRLELTPSSSYEDEGGSDLVDKIIRSDVNPEKLGEALLRAFSACQ